jgi:dynein regulatory complex protein 1
VLTNLRSKLAKQEKQYIDENAQLAEEYKRITEHLHDLQKKSKWVS